MRCAVSRLEVRARRAVRGHAERAARSRASRPRSRTDAYPVRGARRRDLGLHGPASPPPPLPELEWTLLPAGHLFISKRVQDCNWFQAMEGGIDSSHISFLHAPIDHHDSEVTQDMDRASFGVGAAVETGDRAPRFEVVDTDYGVAHRRAPRRSPDGRWYWRITQFLLPFYTMPPADVDEQHRAVAHLGADGRHPRRQLDGDLASRAAAHRARRSRLHVEGKGAHVCDYAPATSEPYGDIRTAANRDNDYLMDWEVHRTRMYCGIPGFGVQDQAIQESQGAHRGPQRRSGWAPATPPSSRCAGGSSRRRGRSASAARGRRAMNPRVLLVRSASVVLPPGRELGGGRPRPHRGEAGPPAHLA